MKSRVCLLVLVLLTCLALPTTSFGQTVRHENFGYNLFLRSFERAAKDQGAACWPLIPKGQAGTWALVTFDAQNCDITFVTRRSYPASSLLTNTRSVARLSGLLRANYIIRESLHTRAVDLELNPYLVRSRFHTRIGLPFGQLADAMGKAGFPAPIAVAVDTSDSTSCNLIAAGRARRLHNYWFSSQNEIPASSAINFDAHLTSSSWFNLALIAAFALLLVVQVIIQIRKNNSNSTTSTDTLSPEEAQRRYDKSAPRWVMLFLPALPVAVVPLFIITSNHAVTIVSFLNPAIQIIALLCPVVVLVLVPALLSSSNKRKQSGAEQTMPVQPATNKKTANPKITFFPFYAFLPMIALLAYVMFNPPLTYHQSRIYHWLIYGVSAFGYLMIAYFVYRSLTANRGKRTPAPEQWRQMAFELAELRGVPIKRVVVIDTRIANAYATAFGTVGLTTRLIDDFPPEQVKAIIAHELGHLKAGHPQHRLALVGGTIVILNALLFFAINYKSPQASLASFEHRQLFIMGFYLINPLVVMTFGKWFRRNEAEADAFAVTAIGDTETVIDALQHIHVVNGSPMRLRPADEAIASHPSLENRIKAIRKLSQREPWASDK